MYGKGIDLRFEVTQRSLRGTSRETRVTRQSRAKLEWNLEPLSAIARRAKANDTGSPEDR